MEQKMIKSETEYQEALEKLDAIFDAEAGSEQGKELENLVFIIDKYEKEHFPVGMPDAVEAIKFRTEQMNYVDNKRFKVHAKSHSPVIRRKFECV